MSISETPAFIPSPVHDMSATSENPSSGTHEDSSTAVRATLTLFGFPDSTVTIYARPRSTAWRASRASGFLGGGLVCAAFLGMVPPHAPWVALALGAGLLFGIRKWQERWTIVSFEAVCPHCGGRLRLPAGTSLRPVLSLPCEGCHYESRLTAEFPS